MDSFKRLTTKLRQRSPNGVDAATGKTGFVDEKNASTTKTPRRKSLKRVTYPKVAAHDQSLLASDGWTPLSFSEHDEVKASFDTLFQASNTFFNQPTDAKEKYKTSLGSEEGWSKIPGEKEMITLRTGDNTPDVLKEAAEHCWNLANRYLNSVLGLIAKSLDLPPAALQKFSAPQLSLPPSERHAAMLRLFRYEVHEDKVVAEPHNDLGLLSLVVSDTPGLEVWDRRRNCWVDIERQTGKPVVLCGRQLQRLSNNVYPPGGHLVRSYGADAWCERPNPLAIKGVSSPRYRHSIVVILRAHWPVMIDSNELTSKVTGPFVPPIRGMKTKDFFLMIKGQHYNINTGLEARAKQKADIEARKKGITNGVRETASEDGASEAPFKNEEDGAAQRSDTPAKRSPQRGTTTLSLIASG